MQFWRILKFAQNLNVPSYSITTTLIFTIYKIQQNEFWKRI